MNFLKRFLILITALILKFGLLSSFKLDIYFDFVLIMLFFWALKPVAPWQLYSLVMIGGLLTDLFIGTPLGTKTLLYLIFCFLIYFVRKNFWRSFGMTSLLIMGLVSFLIFKILENIYFYLLGILNNWTILGEQILINIFLVFLIAFIFRKRILNFSV
jgi:rod shape-determining protein MreD